MVKYFIVPPELVDGQSGARLRRSSENKTYTHVVIGRITVNTPNPKYRMGEWHALSWASSHQLAEKAAQACRRASYTCSIMGDIHIVETMECDRRWKPIDDERPEDAVCPLPDGEELCRARKLGPLRESDMKPGHYYDVCETCGALWELEPGKDIILEKEGHHPNCQEKDDHYHLAYPFYVCPDCRRK